MENDLYEQRPLVELVEIYDSMRVPVKKTDRKSGPYPYYGASGIADYVDSYIFDGEYILLAEDGENLKSRNTPIAFLASGKFWVNNHAHILQANSSSNTRFLCYALQVSDVNSYLSGSTRPKLTQGDMKRILVFAPERSTQQAIANILGSLDDRIELNRRMNETLEAMAQALFKSWFVDFDPVIDNALAGGKEVPEELAERAAVRAALGDKRKPLPAEIRALFPDEFVYIDEMGWIPKGWEVTKIGDELETILGGTPARKNKEFWNNGSIPWINSGKVNEFRVIEPSELITEEAVRKSATKLLPKRTTLLAITGATLGQVSLNEIECCANQSVVGILGKEELPNEFVYLWITNNIEGIISSQTGGAQQHINKGNVNEASILLPSQKIMNCFLQIGTSYFDKISLNCFSNKTLATLRDTLLPKLLSGELRIPKGEV
ncbi:hypothetical protein GCAAIG_09275 [Candidatus Electronema halotolerans]